MNARILFFVAIALYVLVASGETSRARAQGPDIGVSQPERRLFVVGRDQEVPVNATLPASCAGADVTVGLFQHGGARRVNEFDPSFERVVAKVDGAGAVSASVPLPQNLPSGPVPVWPGASGSCLEFPLVSVAPGLLIGLLDASENPGASAAFVIPAASLRGVRSLTDVPVSLAVFADGEPCTTADLEDVARRDGDGNARIHVGGPSQPPACSREGALISFRYPGGEVLYEKREFVAGVTQPFSNLAPEAGHSAAGTPPTALAPSTGQSLSSTAAASESDARFGRIALIGLGLALTVIVLLVALRGRSGKAAA